MSTFSMTDHYRRADAVMQLIYINCFVWLCSVVLGWVGLWEPIKDFLSVYSGVLPCLLHAWGLVTYMFVNAGFMTLLGFMLLLFWFGHIMLTRMSGPQFVALYLFSGIMGGAAFALVASGSAVGCEAALAGVIVATAVMDPDTEVPILFVGRVKTVWLSVVILALFLISNHTIPFVVLLMGGAAGGWLFATMLKNGKDLSKPFTNVINHLGIMFSKKKNSEDNQQGPKYHYAENVVNNCVDDMPSDAEGQKSDAESQMPKTEVRNDMTDADKEEVERILSKIRSSGYSSLTDDEKQRIFK